MDQLINWLNEMRKIYEWKIIYFSLGKRQFNEYQRNVLGSV